MKVVLLTLEAEGGRPPGDLIWLKPNHSCFTSEAVASLGYTRNKTLNFEMAHRRKLFRGLGTEI